MHSLNHNVIDFLSKYCKSEEHKNCYGSWAGLGVRVGCNCSCHHNNKRNSFGGKNNQAFINTLSQNSITQDKLYSNSNDSNQNKIDDICERDEAAKLHFSQYHLTKYKPVSDIATIVNGEELFW